MQFESWAGTRVVGTAGPANHDHVRSLGAEAVAYGDGLVERVRDLVPEGPSVILDFAGGDALEATPEVGNAGLRLVGVTNPDRTKAVGGRYIFVRLNADQLAERGRFAADDGSMKIHVRETLPFETRRRRPGPGPTTSGYSLEMSLKRSA